MRMVSKDFYVKIESALLVTAPVKITMPVSDYEKVEQYDKDVVQFELDDDLFFLPNGARDVALKLLIVDVASQESSPPRRHFPHL